MLRQNLTTVKRFKVRLSKFLLFVTVLMYPKTYKKINKNISYAFSILSLHIQHVFYACSILWCGLATYLVLNGHMSWVYSQWQVVASYFLFFFLQMILLPTIEVKLNFTSLLSKNGTVTVYGCWEKIKWINTYRRSVEHLTHRKHSINIIYN